MKNLLPLALGLLLFSCAPVEQANEIATVDNPKIMLSYPNTKEDSIKDVYHGTSISDPFRWLEVDTADLVESWVNEQNEVTFGYLEKIPYRQQIEDRYADLFNYVKLSSPYQAGEYNFFYKNDGLQNQSVIYKQKGKDGEPTVFIDPNKMSKDGTTDVNILGFSKDYKYIAYSISESGSDWNNIRIREVATDRELPDIIQWVKFSGVGWKGDGFYYSRFPEPKEGTEYSASSENSQIFYHKLGDPQSKDRLVYQNKTNPKIYNFGGTSEDENYLVIGGYDGTEGNELFYKDLQKNGPIKKLIEGHKNKNYFIGNNGKQLLIITNYEAPNYRLVTIDPDDSAPEKWKDIIPEQEEVLESVSSAGGQLFATYMKDATNKVFQFDRDGKNKKEIPLPGLGSAGGFAGRENDKTVFYTFSSFTYPQTIFKYDIENGSSEQFFKAELKFDPEEYVEKQVFYTSKDGTKVPMFIVHKKGLDLNGQNPTYLYGYGGFNISLTPWFSTSRLILLENGGVFALPNLRGGGEYGESWHEAGMLLNKQNVFDDFIAAAEYLIEKGYTNSDKLAIAGGSNGGLLVGACMTQRPDLFAVALPAVGVMDMLRYHKFTVGWGWVPEYGSSEEEEHFHNLLSYSPLHNLKAGVNYPATMVTTADHDDRVVPAHSFKFAAQLQKSHQGENPVVIRIEKKAGHGAGKPTSKIIEEEADRWSFVFYNTNTPVIYMKG